MRRVAFRRAAYQAPNLKLSGKMLEVALLAVHKEKAIFFNAHVANELLASQVGARGHRVVGFN